jgi:hypothetical protein
MDNTCPLWEFLIERNLAVSSDSGAAAFVLLLYLCLLCWKDRPWSFQLNPKWNLAISVNFSHTKFQTWFLVCDSLDKAEMFWIMKRLNLISGFVSCRKKVFVQLFSYLNKTELGTNFKFKYYLNTKRSSYMNKFEIWKKIKIE